MTVTRLRPAVVCAALLEALDASEGRRRRRKRDTTPDAIGMSLKRQLLAQSIEADPDPDAFEAWLRALPHRVRGCLDGRAARHGAGGACGVAVRGSLRRLSRVAGRRRSVRGPRAGIACDARASAVVPRERWEVTDTDGTEAHRGNRTRQLARRARHVVDRRVDVGRKRRGRGHQDDPDGARPRHHADRHRAGLRIRTVRGDRGTGHRRARRTGARADRDQGRARVARRPGLPECLARTHPGRGQGVSTTVENGLHRHLPGALARSARRCRRIRRRVRSARSA